MNDAVDKAGCGSRRNKKQKKNQIKREQGESPKIYLIKVAKVLKEIDHLRRILQEWPDNE